MPYSINDFMPSQDTLNNIKSLGSIDPVGSFRKGQADAEAAKQKSLMDALQLREGEANIEQSQSAVAQNNAQTAELNRQAQVRKDAQGMWANYQTQVTADPKNKDKITDNFKMELSRIGDKEGLDQLYKEEEAELNRLSAFDAMETNRTTRAKNQADTDATNEDRVLLNLVKEGKLPLYEFARVKKPEHALKMQETFLNLLDSAAHQLDQFATPEEQFQYAATILDPMLKQNASIIQDLGLQEHYTQFRQAIDSQNPAALTTIINGLGALVQEQDKGTDELKTDEVRLPSGIKVSKQATLSEYRSTYGILDPIEVKIMMQGDPAEYARYQKRIANAPSYETFMENEYGSEIHEKALPDGVTESQLAEFMAANKIKSKNKAIEAIRGHLGQ